jgi:hypothetical protein
MNLLHLAVSGGFLYILDTHTGRPPSSANPGLHPADQNTMVSAAASPVDAGILDNYPSR